MSGGRTTPSIVLSVLLLLWTSPLLAHPWGGLVVDDSGNIYFTYICPMDGDDHLACVYRIDHGTSTPKPVLVASSDPSDMILARSPSRTIYAAERVGSHPYRTRLWRLAQDDDPVEVIPFSPPERFAPAPYAVADDGQVFFARDGEIVAYNNAALTETVAKSLSTSGVAVSPGSTWLLTVRDETSLVAVIDNVLIAIEHGKPADRINGSLREREPPGLPFRGANILFDIAFDGDRTVLAYFGNRQVVEIRDGGGRYIPLRAEPPWSPHGVDVFGGKVFVLESTIPRPSMNFWDPDLMLPRIRVLEDDGRVTEVYSHKKK